jgi:hypothetical protein
VALDYLRLAREQDREEFVSGCPFPFLVGAARLVQPELPRKTGRFEVVSGPFSSDPTEVKELPREGAERPLVVPVRKVQDLFPHMITVGRTRNNDVVLEDVLISKFHAFFRHKDGAWELTDAGSANGTRVGDAALASKAAAAVSFGARIGFAQLEFKFLDAGRAWDELRGHSAP